LESDPAIVVENLFDFGFMAYLALNWLHPPFNNVKCRQAMLHIVNQDEMMRPTFGSQKWYHPTGSYFTPARRWRTTPTPTGSGAGPTSRVPKQLLAEGGYDGRPVVLLQATTQLYMMNGATVLAQEMRSAGMNVDLQPMDWANVVARRASQSPPDQGGWNIFLTGVDGFSRCNPFMLAQMATNGTKAWFGWPSDERNEQLRAQWLVAKTLEESKAIARQIQENAWNVVPHMVVGPVLHPLGVAQERQGLDARARAHSVLGPSKRPDRRAHGCDTGRCAQRNESAWATVMDG